MIKAIVWYVREVSGENDYGHYVAHMRRLHGDAPVLSRREFERRKASAREATPAARCC